MTPSGSLNSSASSFVLEVASTVMHGLPPLSSVRSMRLEACRVQINLLHLLLDMTFETKIRSSDVPVSFFQLPIEKLLEQPRVRLSKYVTNPLQPVVQQQVLRACHTSALQGIHVGDPVQLDQLKYICYTLLV